VTWIDARSRSLRIPGILQLSSALELIRIRRGAAPALGAADVVHLHSNGLLPEAAGLLARRLRKPVVLTLYGTEIWHYAPRRFGVDLFTRAYVSATHVTFYSRGLMDRALELGLSRDRLTVVYPPVAEYFSRVGDAARQAARASLGLRERHVLLNVKRLHPLAGQRHLLEAMPAILAAHPDTRLVVCGTGLLRDELAARAASLGVGSSVTFAGLVDNRTVAHYQEAADLFVLPSELEACPTVAVEALACGTPVVSTDNPGGVELGALFGDDVQVVPRGSPAAIAEAVARFLSAKRRTAPASDVILSDHFRPRAVAARYRDIYRDVVSASRP
jgi:glycosyltransferase involved in cell wall biosynthesis